MVDDPLFDILAHFFVVVFGFIKHPLDIRDSLSLYYLAPASTFLEYFSDQFFIIVGS